MASRGNSVERLIEAAQEGGSRPVYLVHGDLVLAEPTAMRLAEALAKPSGCPVETVRRPAGLGEILADLKTFSLFASAKVIVALDTAVLAERTAGADLLDDAEDGLPAPEVGGELSSKARKAASRLLQALRLFGLNPDAGEPGALLDELPAWAFQGGRRVRKRKPRGRSKKDVGALKEGLAGLLAAARHSDLLGFAEGDSAELSEILRAGLPEGHTLILVERSAAADHPVTQALAEAGVVLGVGVVESERRGGWQGLREIASELERQTGVAMAPRALDELARRTLRQERQGAVNAESTARLAGEYRKLAALAGEGGSIDRAMVEETVEDRGQEDVWKILDAVGTGRPAEAIGRLQRLIGAGSDAIGARLSFFGLLASFCRQLTAIRGAMRIAGVSGGESNYNRFKNQVAPRLQGELPGNIKNPLAGLHPFRLHRAYLAASRISDQQATVLPWKLLETEARLKGESADPDSAMASFLTYLSAPKR